MRATNPAMATASRPPATRSAAIAATCAAYPESASRPESRSTCRSTATGPLAEWRRRSLELSTPATFPSRSTARWCTPPSRNERHAAKIGVVAGTVRSGEEATRATGVAGPRSSARTRSRRSRSVRMPAGAPRTRTEPTRSSRITRAASCTVAAPSIHRAGRCKSDATSRARSDHRKAVAAVGCRRLALSRSAIPAAKCPAKRGIRSRRLNSSAGTR